MNEIFLLEGAVKDTSGSTPSRPNRFSKPGYSIKLCHRSGASNKMCDYRSRFPASSSSEEDLVATLVAELETDTEDQDLAPSENPEEEIDHRPVSQEEIREEQRKVPEYKKIIDALDSNIPEAITQYELGDDTLRLKAESSSGPKERNGESTPPQGRRKQGITQDQEQERRKKAVAQNIYLQGLISGRNQERYRSPRTSNGYQERREAFIDEGGIAVAARSARLARRRPNEGKVSRGGR
ncbi:hypothetical protein QR680_007931 [Steinernema hermaphroditum]|uniref:Uncharacterized protein n=1 Tax=Steinernema hermaphroditum TaxID=289476 RepID=A0AA39IGW8_9BILA|nr:hypothetical protein QR680_007931 [Steinernema hermaphroditum]